LFFYFYVFIFYLSPPFLKIRQSLDGFATRIKVKFQIPIRHPPGSVADWRTKSQINPKPQILNHLGNSAKK